MRRKSTWSFSALRLERRRLRQITEPMDSGLKSKFDIRIIDDCFHRRRMSTYSMNGLERAGTSLKNIETLLQGSGIELFALVIHSVTYHCDGDDRNASGAAKREQ